ncbi:P-loop containing nucleoside triphosphate hydrolase protein, partial [Mycena amicta]
MRAIPPGPGRSAKYNSLVLDGARRVRANRAQCIQLVEQIHEVLCALVTLCGGAGGDVPTLSLSLGMLHSISQLTETLQQAHAYVSAQADTGMFKRIIKQAEHAARFEECSAGLRKALEAFGIRSNMLLQVEQMHDEARKRHEELLALMEAVRLEREEEDFDVDEDEDGSLTARNSLKSSSTSLSLLPSSPQIFHGRDAELSTCVGALCASEPARLAILGPGGMGKTSLSLSVIHDQSIEAFFGVHRYFIPLNGTSSVADMVAKIAAQFDITHQQPEKAVLRRLGEIGARAPVLVVLDNLEDCWEPSTSRAKVEDFLSLLTDVPQLHLVVTLRGVERPNKIKWTRPFLPPLAPLSLDAARDTFLDHTDDPDDLPAMTKLLALTDHLPLAICLLANLAAYEGSCTPVLERWNSQTTAMVSSGAGSDKLSSLDTSIALSLSSARIAAEPHAITLLSILALLPDGVTRSDLDEMDLPSPFSLATIARAESALVRSSLAYRDNHRVRVLAPIREYARKHCPLPMELSEPVKRHYF